MKEFNEFLATLTGDVKEEIAARIAKEQGEPSDYGNADEETVWYMPSIELSSKISLEYLRLYHIWLHS